MRDKTNTRNLADITKVRVDQNLPQFEKNLEYVRQMNGDPYHFICNGWRITAIYNPDGPTFADCIRRIAMA